MILDYNNYSARYSARADLVFDGNCDLTANKAAILSIWLKGNPANTPGFFYVKLEDANANTALQSLTDPNVVRLNCWSELLFDLKEFTGIDLTRIRRLSIGTNSASPAPAGADRGIVYIDNIMLSAARRSEEKLASDLNGDCIVNAADLKLLFTDWGEI